MYSGYTCLRWVLPGMCTGDGGGGGILGMQIWDWSETPGTWSKECPSQGWEWIDVTEPIEKVI